MSALVKACDVSTSIKNTGIECSAAMGPTKMIIAVPTGLKWTSSDMNDFASYIQTKMHAATSSRVYPLFGNNAPIRTLNVNDGDDVTQTFDDGFEVFIRAGYANRILETNQGGLCYAKALRSFLNANMSFIEVDGEGQVAFKKNTDGTFSGFPAYMGGVTPKAASFTEKYMNRFRLSYDPTNYINSGVIYSGAEALLDFMGLIDAEVTSAGTASTTVLKLAVTTECADTDLVALLGSDLAQITNFVVTKKSDGTHPSISAAAIENGYVKLTGTFTSSAVYNVKLAAPATLFANGVEGYSGEADAGVDITIP